MSDESRWFDDADSGDPLLPSLSDSEILGVIDSYDDIRIDTVFVAYLKLRREVQFS